MRDHEDDHAAAAQHAVRLGQDGVLVLHAHKDERGHDAVERPVCEHRQIRRGRNDVADVEELGAGVHFGKGDHSRAQLDARDTRATPRKDTAQVAVPRTDVEHIETVDLAELIEHRVVGVVLPHVVALDTERSVPRLGVGIPRFTDRVLVEAMVVGGALRHPRGIPHEPRFVRRASVEVLFEVRRELVWVSTFELGPIEGRLRLAAPR